MVKEGYKEVKRGLNHYQVPNYWDVKWLNEIADYSGGSQPPKKTFVNEEKEGYVRLYQIRDYTGSQDKPAYIPEDKASKTTEKGDIIIGRYGASIGKVFLAEEGAYNVAMVKVLLEDNTNKKYMYYYFNSKIFQDRLNIGVRAAQSGFNKDDWATFSVPLPPLPEQKKIASILSSVDKSIEKTDEVIEETKELKKGLMQELLTKGIGHSEFKDSQFGEIPKSWEINVMSYAAKINPKYKTPEQDEYLFLEMDSVNEHSPEVDGYEKREKSRCTNVKFKKGDVLFARITPSTENGKTALIENIEEEIAFGSTELIVLSPKKDLITSDYIYYLLKWSKVRNLAISMMEGSTGRQRVPREVFDGAIKIPLPPLEEQKKIASILSSVDAKIQKEEEYKAKLEKLKKGLMQKLLTGEIRVNTKMEV